MSFEDPAAPSAPAIGEFVRLFERAYPPTVPQGDRPTIWLPFSGNDLVVQQKDDGEVGLLSEAPSPAADPLYLGTLAGSPCLTYAMDSPENGTLSSPIRAISLRSLHGQVDDARYALAGYASHILRFYRESRFCPVDGTPTEPVSGGWARKCALCGHTYYPPVSPAVLILVHDGADRILLARKPGWGRRYSILAGFVEPGETLEECCWRESLEEAGVETADFIYQGSQPWPFPHQLMIGFFCRYTSGEIRPDETELEHVDWFRFDALPELPPPLSLSRQLIDRWTAERRKVSGQ